MRVTQCCCTNSVCAWLDTVAQTFRTIRQFDTPKKLIFHLVQECWLEGTWGSHLSVTFPVVDGRKHQSMDHSRETAIQWSALHDDYYNQSFEMRLCEDSLARIILVWYRFHWCNYIMVIRDNNAIFLKYFQRKFNPS